MLNGKTAKASTNVKAGDILEVQFGNRVLKAEIVSISETVKKEEAAEMYKLI